MRTQDILALARRQGSRKQFGDPLWQYPDKYDVSFGTIFGETIKYVWDKDKSETTKYKITPDMTPEEIRRIGISEWNESRVLRRKEISDTFKLLKRLPASDQIEVEALLVSLFESKNGDEICDTIAKKLVS